MATPKWRVKEFRDFPAYKVNYLIAFEKILENNRVKGIKTKWKMAEDVFRWWMEDKTMDGQMKLDEMEDG